MQPAHHMTIPTHQSLTPAHPIAFGPIGPLQQAKFGGFIPMAQAVPPGPTTPTVALQFTHPRGTVFPQYAMSPSHLPQATMLPQAFQTLTLQQPNWNMDTGASSHISENEDPLASSLL
ncbi:hypothetical protein Tco_1462406 [Tanacetum coccineum]